MEHVDTMYSQHATMAPQKPETFMLSTEAQQALPHDAQVALQQVDNCRLQPEATMFWMGSLVAGDLYLLTADVCSEIFSHLSAS